MSEAGAAGGVFEENWLDAHKLWIIPTSIIAARMMQPDEQAGRRETEATTEHLNSLPELLALCVRGSIEPSSWGRGFFRESLKLKEAVEQCSLSTRPQDSSEQILEESSMSYRSKVR